MVSENIKNDCPYYEENICETKECICAKYKAFKEVQKPGVIQNIITNLGINSAQDNWNIMMDIQKSFSSKFKNIDDMKKEDMDKWINQYLLCMEDEIAELREYLDIYPDQSAKSFNDKEIKKEMIDILHFVMEVFISGKASPDDIKKYYLKKYCPEVESVKDFIKFSFDFQTNLTASLYGRFDNITILLLLSCKLLDISSSIRKLISWKHWKKPNDNINFEDLYMKYAELYKAMIDLFLILLTSEEIKQIYLEKNVENILRQNFNY